MAKHIRIQVKVPGTTAIDGGGGTWTALGPQVKAQVAEAKERLIKREEDERRRADLVVYVRVKRGEPYTSLLVGKNLRIEAAGKTYEILDRSVDYPDKTKWCGLWLGEASDG